jgi:tetratricopeptide (TPR) repeat protein
MVSSKIASMIVGIGLQCRRGTRNTSPTRKKSATVREKSSSHPPWGPLHALSKSHAHAHSLAFLFFLIFVLRLFTDTSKMYDWWASKASGGVLEDGDDAYDDSYEELKVPPRRAAAQRTNQQTPAVAAAESEVDFALVLAKAFGVEVGPNARVEAVADGGQFAAAGARVGDLIVACGTSQVASSEDWEAAVAEHRREGHPKMVVTFRGPSRGRPRKRKFKTWKQTPETAAPAEGESGGANRKLRSGSSSGGAAVTAADAAAAEAVTVQAVDLIRRGDLAGALPLFLQATALNPFKVDLWSNLGNVRRDSGHIAEAKQAYQRGLRLDPANQHLLASLQELAASVGRTAENPPPTSGLQAPQLGSRRPHEGLCDDGLEVEVRHMKKWLENVEVRERHPHSNAHVFPVFNPQIWSLLQAHLLQAHLLFLLPCLSSLCSDCARRGLGGGAGRRRVVGGGRRGSDQR